MVPVAPRLHPFCAPPHQVTFLRVCLLITWIGSSCLFGMAEDDARLRNRQGVLHAQRGDLLTAIQSFEKARLADPLDDTALTNLSCAHNNMGVLLCRERRFAEAIDHFEKAKKQKPEDLQIRFNLLSALVMIRDAEHVDLEARGILALRPRDPETINKVANAFLKIEDDDSARNLLERILEVDPSYAPALLSLSRMFYHQGNFIEARHYLDRTMEASPRNASATELLKRLQREERVESAFDRESSVHFTLFYPAGFPRDWVGEVLNLFEDAYVRVGELMNSFPSQRTQVIVYSPSDFQRVSTLPSWAGGLYDGKIRLPVPRSVSQPEQLRGAVQHEYCHHVVHLLTGNSCPTWLNEGLAQIAEGLDAEKAKQHLQEHDSMRIPPLKALDGPFAHARKREAAETLYAQSLYAAQWLIEEKGWPALQELLESLAKRLSFDEALQKTYGFNAENLDERLRRSLD